MTTPTNALSYNLYVQQIGIMAVVQTVETAGVWAFVDAAVQGALPSMLNYAELRIARDLNMLASQSSNNYTLTAGQNVFSLPVDDFVTVQTLEITQTATSTITAGAFLIGITYTIATIGTTDFTLIGAVSNTVGIQFIATGMGSGTGTATTMPVVVNSGPLAPVSKEFIQNCYGGIASSGTPRYFAMYGDNFSDEQDSFTNILFGPSPNFPYTLRVTGSCRGPSLFQNAAAGIADTEFTYISAYYPDILVMASMIYISAFQRNFGPTSDTPESGMTYEKQYQALRLGAVSTENQRNLQGSGWSAYSTPTSATPTR